MQLNGMPWYAYVLIAVVGLMFVGQLVWKAKGAVKQLRRAAQSYRRSPTPAAPDKLFALAVGAVNGEQLTATVDSLGTGIDRGRIIQGLAENWSVTNGESARGTLDWLLNEGHRVYFESVVRIARTDKSTWESGVAGFDEPSRVLEYVEHFAATEKDLREAGMIQSNEDIGRGILAWDVGRAINVARMAFDAGFINEAEAWRAIDTAARMARESFRAWEQVGKSYIIGRAMWSGEGMMLDGLIGITKGLLADAESPWVQRSWPG